MENDDKESHLASAVHGVTHPDAHDEQLSDALERLAALESQHTIPELVRKVIGLLKEWRSGAGRDKQAVYINVRGDAHDKGKVKSNLRRLKKHIADGRIDSIFVSITATNHPVPALHDAIEALKSVAPVWTGIARLELEVVLTSHSRLEMIRSLHRYQASLGPIFKSITSLLPGPLEFVAKDRSGCAVVGELFEKLTEFYSSPTVADRPAAKAQDATGAKADPEEAAALAPGGYAVPSSADEGACSAQQTPPCAKRTASDLSHRESKRTRE